MVIVELFSSVTVSCVPMVPRVGFLLCLAALSSASGRSKKPTAVRGVKDSDDAVLVGGTESY